MRIEVLASAGGELRIGRWIEQHWLAVLNLLVALFAALPLAAPMLMAAGWQQAGRWIYSLYHLACHQYPARAYFLFGAAPVYEGDALGALARASHFVGSPELGW